MKNPGRMILLPLIVGIAFDWLFWGKGVGVSFFLFVLLFLAVGGALAYLEGKHPARASLWLLLPIVFFAFTSFVWDASTPRAVAYTFALASIVLFAGTFSGGRWLWYGIGDYLAVFLLVPLSSTFVQLSLFSQVKEENTSTGLGDIWRKALPWVRGILLAIPILLVFGALLTSADPIFLDYVRRLTSIFSIRRLPEYLTRFLLILTASYIALGLYYHAFTSIQEGTIIGVEGSRVKPFLGFTEAGVVLVSVDALFAAFVAIQFRYFFGGEANISAAGYTYATYARKGFGELITVTVASLLLILALGWITKREGASARKIFSSLVILLVLLVGIILVSAFQRLSLYESAYGFTELRFYVHVFMVWVGVLLAAVAVLTAMDRPRTFALAIFLAALGFGATLELVNGDAFIVRRNVDLAHTGHEVDRYYLSHLPEDAVPALIDAYIHEEDPKTANALAAAVACNAAFHDEYPEVPWQQFTIAHWRARKAWLSLKSDPQHRLSLPKKNTLGRWSVRINGAEFHCSERWGRGW